LPVPATLCRQTIIRKIKKDTMNKLLNAISWGAYMGTIVFLTLAYYAFIGWKYYRHEISKLIARLSGNTGDNREMPAALIYRDEAENNSLVVRQADARHPQEACYKEFTGAIYDLAQQLKTTIGLATGQPFNPARLLPKLKKILNDYPDIAATPDRAEINLLIVRECEKTGTAPLSESEVDKWWSA
jgi:hypothetical protein